MTDEEKIKWFDETLDWMEQFGDSDGMRDHIDFSGEAAYDLWLDMVNQYEKARG